MKLKAVIDEDLTNYKVPSMFLFAPTCEGKCCIEAGLPLFVCQNHPWRDSPAMDFSYNELCQRYLKNKLTHAIVIGGLEPFENFLELSSFIMTLRWDYHCYDPVVIYTGYKEDELSQELETLSNLDNIIIKFGRYRPDLHPVFDEVLGVFLASGNQYAKQIS